MKLLDFYQRNARLYPALLALLSPMAVGAAILPVTDGAIKALVDIVVACGSLYLLSDIARARGRSVQVALVRTWGAMPTTIFLRHADEHLSKTTKVRYHDFFRQCLGDDAISTPEDEARDPAAADEQYDSCVAWLREQCRGNEFNLLLKENATYGFRRNMLGLRTIGIVLCACGLLVPLAVEYGKNGTREDWQALLLASYAPSPGIGVATSICLLMLLWWTLVVTPRWVRNAADIYAGSLLACSDKLRLGPK